MAAYAALLSLMHTIQHLKNHPRPPISLDREQVHSLTQNLTFLQDFLERYSSSSSEEEEDELENRIADAAYAAEDVIESHIVDQIHAVSDSSLVYLYQRPRGVIYAAEDVTGSHIVDQIHAVSNISSVDLYQGLQRVIQDMDLIRKEVMEIIKENTGARDQLHRNSSVSTGSSRPASMGTNSTMVGFDDVLIEVLDKLTGQKCNLQIIPIVGMGGIGKTTLARNIYTHPHIVQHFDFLAWVTISQEYSRREILLQVLPQENRLSEMSEEKLGEEVHKKLWGRRYLIVMDDLWSIEAWDKVRSFFPDNNNGSKIMITTRLSNVAFEVSGSHDFQMKLLDEDKSWDLLWEIVFGKEGCPIELEDIGKEIARNCRGLPLSIVVIGGLLTKSNRTREYWEYTLENLNSIINLENDEHCLQILRTSYKELPVHLKPCFLFMGVFQEDAKIHVSELIKLWVAEGILKPIDDKSLEEVAKEYVKQLVDRNLILVHELSWNGKAKLCKIHDVLRDLCLREAQRQGFLCVIRQQDLSIPQGINIERRVCIRKDTPGEYSPQSLHALQSAALTRSLFLIRGSQEPSPSFSFKLLRVYSTFDNFFSFVLDYRSVGAIFLQANLRYLSIRLCMPRLPRFPFSWSLLWNLQTLILQVPYPGAEPTIAPSEIWKMPLLRHAILRGLELPDPSCRVDIFLENLQAVLSGIWDLSFYSSEEHTILLGQELLDPPCQEDNIVLENLQTLAHIWDFKCSEEVVKRIPNIKTLKLNYSRSRLIYEPTDFRLNNIGHLQNLESLSLSNMCRDEIFNTEIFRNLTFPNSLKKLILYGAMLCWEDLTAKIGSLPLLQVLKLRMGACSGPKWETVEEQFCSLKFLLIDWSSDLKYWKTDSTHFPRLEHLVLQNLRELEEIPSSIGDIPTLQSIQLNSCSESAVESAKRIKEEQVDNGNVDLQVQIGSLVLS